MNPSSAAPQQDFTHQIECVAAAHSPARPAAAAEPPPVSIESIRAQFPALAASGTVFLENAGGSQVPRSVADAVRDYMLHHYVNAGAAYELSRRATAINVDAHDFINRFMNGEDRGQVILGPSSTALCRMLAGCYRQVLQPGDEVIVSEAGHEANIGPWLELAAQGVIVKFWRVDPATFDLPIDALRALLSPRTKIVAFPHVSNVLGGIVDVKAIAELAHGVGAKVVVDGVAFASHQSIDVAAWGVDWYVYSTYKVFGPHMGALFGTHEALAELTGPNHYFIPRTEVPRKFEVGGANPEGCAGLLGLRPYLHFLAGREPPNEEVSRATIEAAYRTMAHHEEPLTERLMRYLRGKAGVRILGPSAAPGNPAHRSRVGTISFVHARKSSREIAEYANARGLGIRHGHSYSYRLCEALGLKNPADGVVRASFVHYNTPAEIDRLVATLDEVLD